MGKYRRISKLIPGIAVFAMPLLWAGSAHATENIAGSAMPVGASLEGASVTVSTDGAVDIEVVPTANGSLGVGKGEVTVDTTSNSGYTLYISSPNVDTNGYASLYLNGNPAYSAKITGLPSTTPASLGSVPNQWGYAIPGSGAGFANTNDYNAVLGTSTTDEVLINNLKWKGVSSSYTLAKTGNKAGEDKIPVYFGVYANTDIMSGNYMNTVVYTAFVEGNGRLAIAPGEVEDGERATITTEYKATGHPVSASDINITMYNDDTNNIMAICNDIQVIQDGSSAPLTFSCKIDKQPEASVIPYDIEVKIAREDGNYYTYVGENSWHFVTNMQDITTADVRAMQEGETYVMKDSRDGKKYVVRKLADGEVWMTQNLDLDLVNENETMGTKKLGTDEFVAFTKENTNISNNTWTIPEGSQGHTTQTATGVYWNQWGCANSSYSATWAASGANKYDVSTWCATGYEVRSYDEGNNCVTVSAAASGTDTIAACNTILGSANPKHAGNMYNWVAATAGTGTYATTNGEASGSICPKGWRLPYGGAVSTPKSWYNMLNKYTTMTHGIAQSTATWAALTGAPVSEVRAGYYYFTTAALGYRGTGGFGWASTAYSAQYGYYLNFNQSLVYPGTRNGSKGYGFQLRCVADPIQTMQDFSSEDAAAMSNGDEKILEDVRDGKQYVVRKLADGNVWMTQNLDLNLVNQNEVMGTTNLRTGKFVQFSKSNTNIDAASWTIPEGSQGYNTQTADGVYWNQRGCANSSYSATWAADGANKYDVGTWCATGYEVRSRRLDDCTTYSNAYGTADSIAACDTATGVANTKRNGVMYNYVAATAGSKSYASGAGEAGDSICPKGWRLPTGGVSGEMHAMFAAQKVIKSTAEGGVAGELTATDIRPGTGGNLNVGTTRFGEMITAMASNPISAVRSGYYRSHEARMDYRGTAGYWWSSTATSSTAGYYMSFHAGGYYPGTSHNAKGYGFGIRCIAD